MTKRARVLSTTVAGLATAAALALPATPAEAATSSVYLYTANTLDQCVRSGDNGVQGGVFSSYTCQNGFAGYSLSVTATRARGSSQYVDLGTMSYDQCQSAGQNGVAGKVFSDYYCQLGLVDWILMVRD